MNYLKMKRNKYLLALASVIVLFAGVVQAHEIRPAYLGITEDKDHTITILWKQPIAGDVGIKLIPHLSSGWLEQQPTELSGSHSFFIKKWIINAAKGSVAGQVVTIEGLDQTITDVLVNVSLANGKTYSEIIKPTNPTYTISANAKPLQVISYIFLGIEHILEGVDHLLFVLGFLLLVTDKKLLFKTITAFTVAHSITLTAATMKWVTVQPAVVETVIALSIVFMAVELVHTYQGRPGLTAKYPWLIAFSFGLLHGFGFAGALADVGLPENAIPLTLFLFNVGVEIGQLIFVAVVLGILWLVRKSKLSVPEFVKWIPPYAIGSFSAMWFIERLMVIIVH